VKAAKPLPVKSGLVDQLGLTMGERGHRQAFATSQVEVLGLVRQGGVLAAIGNRLSRVANQVAGCPLPRRTILPHIASLLQGNG